MGFDDGNGESFAELLRSIAQEVGRSVERAAERVDVDELADTVGVDADRAREWVDTAAGWLRAQAENLAEDVATSASGAKPSSSPTGAAPSEDPLRGAAASTLDLPSDEQGTALAALDSGRWIVEPGSESLAVHGDGPAPSDALGLFRELRVRDWIAPDGRLTVAGKHALERWLDARR
jgi:hypothetical protein